MASINTESSIKPAPGVVSQILNDEAVLLLPQQGEVKVLNEVGARIWTLIESDTRLSDITMTLSAEYAVSPAQAQADLLTFMNELLSRGCIVLEQPA